MGGTCSTREREEKCTQSLLEKLKGRDHLENIGIDGRIILRRTIQK
jgi:hypothetical protein